MNSVPTLRTRRLTLRAFTSTDAHRVQRLAGDRSIAETTLTLPHPYADGVAEQWIANHQRRLEAGEMVNFAVIRQRGNILIGAMNLILELPRAQAEIGFWIGRRYWKRGYCTEAGLAVLDYGFTVFRLQEVCGTHLKRNPASGRVLHKLGMLHERSEHRLFRRPGGPAADEVCAAVDRYVIERSEWLEGNYKYDYDYEHET